MKGVQAAIVLFVAVLLLALVGQYRFDPAEFRADPVEQLYRGIQLFTIELDWAEGRALPWELDLARFLAPLVTIAGLVLVFVRGAWVGLINARIRFWRDHVVVVGLNDLGMHFARSCREAGLRAVAVERREDHPNVERCRRLGVPVIVGDALGYGVLERAGVARASHLVTFVRDDGTNVELTLHAKALGREAAAARATPLRVRCHIQDGHLAARLEQYSKFFLDPHLAEVSFFNVQGLAARTLLHALPPDVFADALRRTGVHLAVFGANALAEQVVLQAARTCHYASFVPPRITVCAPSASIFGDRLVQLYPGLEVAATLAFSDMPLSPDALDGVDTVLPVPDATTYVVCLEDESAALSLALALRRATLLGRGLNAPVAVAMSKSDGLARLLEAELGTPEIPDGLQPFGMLDEIVSAATIVDERLDRLARAHHEYYLEGVLEGVLAASSGRPRRRSHLPWASLPEEYRSENRLATDHLDAKLRAVGCIESAVPGPSVEFTAEEVERIAHMEKCRFVAARSSSGWRQGARRVDFARIDTILAPWERMDGAARAYDLKAARDIPTMLGKRLGRTVRREVLIGVTGHRHHRLNGTGAEFVAAVGRTLDHIATLYPGAAFTVLSSLAEGADRLVARLALDRLGARLHVPLPMPYELYVEDFGTTTELNFEDSIAEFHELLGEAERYFELPLAFGAYVELSRENPDSAPARARQYALAGAYVAQRSHELVAVWDGAAEAGEGGTAQIVGWRLGGVPEVYRFPDAFFPAVEAKAPFVVPPDAAAGFTPRRAVA